MPMEEMDIERVYNQGAAFLAVWGIHSKAMAGVLFVMRAGDVGYRDALEVWAECAPVKGWGVERWNAELCYDILKSGMIEQPGRFLARLVEELRD